MYTWHFNRHFNSGGSIVCCCVVSKQRHQSLTPVCCTREPWVIIKAFTVWLKVPRRDRLEIWQTVKFYQLTPPSTNSLACSERQTKRRVVSLSDNYLRAANHTEIQAIRPRSKVEWFILCQTFSPTFPKQFFFFHQTSSNFAGL